MLKMSDDELAYEGEDLELSRGAPSWMNQLSDQCKSWLQSLPKVLCSIVYHHNLPLSRSWSVCAVPRKTWRTRCSASLSVRSIWALNYCRKCGGTWMNCWPFAGVIRNRTTIRGSWLMHWSSAKGCPESGCGSTDRVCPRTWRLTNGWMTLWSEPDS